MKSPFMFVIFMLMCFAVNSSNAKTVSDIAAPEGYTRVNADADSYAFYLRSLPLSTDREVKLWNGTTLPPNYYQQFAVVDLPLMFNEDLEQCADFSMRLWAEYLRSVDSLDHLALYDFYGRKKPFIKSNKSFRDYLRWHMRYSNSYSIKLGAQPVSHLSKLQSGDMFVQNDSEESIGHVSVVIDQAINEVNQQVYLVGYSFMPAQQFHIEQSSQEYGPQGWFTAEGYYRYAEETFGALGKTKIRRYQKYKI